MPIPPGKSAKSRRDEVLLGSDCRGVAAPHRWRHPRAFGSCGDVLDHNTPMLFAHWERRYPYLSSALPLAD